METKAIQVVEYVITYVLKVVFVLLSHDSQMNHVEVFLAVKSTVNAILLNVLLTADRSFAASLPDMRNLLQIITAMPSDRLHSLVVIV